MSKSSKEETRKITDAILLFENGLWSERKKHIKAMSGGGFTTYNGFAFTKETYCYVVWKDTDIESQPQYNGASLYKVIPRNVGKRESLETIINAQAWIYP